MRVDEELGFTCMRECNCNAQTDFVCIETGAMLLYLHLIFIIEFKIPQVLLRL